MQRFYRQRKALSSDASACMADSMQTEASGMDTRNSRKRTRSFLESTPISERPKRASRPPERISVMSSHEEKALLQALKNSQTDVARGRPQEIPEAAVFRPSLEEFTDPVQYIRKIAPEAEKTGIVKIIPPAGWRPPFSVDEDKFQFLTRVQTINELQQGKHFVDRDDPCTLRDWRQRAKNFKESWFASQGRNVADLSPSQIEEEFWRIVETNPQTVKVEYGADLDTATHQSGFPARTAESDEGMKAYAESPWNLLRISRMRGSLLRYLDDDYSGVTHPWVYVGMLFSAFCWHNEDHYMYSINYMHAGEGKTWYGIPSRDASAFERVMRETVLELWETRRGLLHELVTMLSPTLLRTKKVPVYHLLQQPGEFVITFPQVYHAGFSHGFTFAEAVNFAPTDWLPFGRLCVNQYISSQARPPVFSHEKLVLQAAARADELPVADQRALLRELGEIKRRQQELYNELRDDFAGATIMAGPQCDHEEKFVCVACDAFCYMSCLSCETHGMQTCLEHTRAFDCACPKVLQFRHPLVSLQQLIENITQRVGAASAAPTALA